MRPDTYVGSLRLKSSEEYIVSTSDSKTSIIKKKIMFSPGLLRIFIEALSNAIDNVQRSREAGVKCTKIKISLDRETGLTSIWNDGLVIPIENNTENGVYNHTLVFGELLTSTNYDDTEKRTTGGRNGYGAKLTNIFSKFF
jgi:DNA topoisomerase-2